MQWFFPKFITKTLNAFQTKLAIAIATKQNMLVNYQVNLAKQLVGHAVSLSIFKQN